MGYTTKFAGRFLLDPPLSAEQAALLTEFVEARHDGSSGDFDAPSYYCQWVPSKDGAGIEWDRQEKFYGYTDWLNHLIEKFLTPWGISIRGKVAYSGEEVGDAGYLEIRDGRCVKVALMERGNGDITY